MVSAAPTIRKNRASWVTRSQGRRNAYGPRRLARRTHRRPSAATANAAHRRDGESERMPASSSWQALTAGSWEIDRLDLQNQAARILMEEALARVRERRRGASNVRGVQDTDCIDSTLGGRPAKVRGVPRSPGNARTGRGVRKATVRTTLDERSRDPASQPGPRIAGPLASIGSSPPQRSRTPAPGG